MSTVDRCTCPKTGPSSLLVQVGAVKPGLTYAIERKCPVHGDIDEILASGAYTDRRGRLWERSNRLNEWFGGIPGDPLDRAWWCLPREMRLLIERDMHRDECRGMNECGEGHPVARIETMDGYYFTYDAREAHFETMHDTLSEAMDAARALAVGA